MEDHSWKQAEATVFHTYARQQSIYWFTLWKRSNRSCTRTDVFSGHFWYEPQWISVFLCYNNRRICRTHGSDSPSNAGRYVVYLWCHIHPYWLIVHTCGWMDGRNIMTWMLHLSFIHSKMQAILTSREEVAAWLDYEHVDLTSALKLCKPTDDISMRTVSSYVSSSRNQGATCIQHGTIQTKPLVPSNIFYLHTIHLFSYM